MPLQELRKVYKVAIAGGKGGIWVLARAQTSLRSRRMLDCVARAPCPTRRVKGRAICATLYRYCDLRSSGRK